MPSETATGPGNGYARRVLLVTVGALGLLLAGAGLAWACTPQADINVSSASGEAGSSVMVSGAQFESGPLEINWEGVRPLGLAEGPGFTETVRIPDAEPGTYTIVAEQGVHSARARFEVVAERTPSEPGDPADGDNDGAGSPGNGGGGGGSGDEAARNTDDGGGDGARSADESAQPRRSHDGWQPRVPDEPAAESADERDGDDPAGQRSAPAGEPGGRQHVGAPPQADTPGETAGPAGSPASRQDGREHLAGEPRERAAGQPAPGATPDAAPESGDAAPEAGDPEPVTADAGEDPVPAGGEEASEPTGVEGDAQDPASAAAGRGPDADARARTPAPSSRAGSADLWSGFEAGEGTSLTPGAHLRGEAGPLGAGGGTQLAVGVALLAGGLGVLALGGGLGLARRRARVHATVTRAG